MIETEKMSIKDKCFSFAELPGACEHRPSQSQAPIIFDKDLFDAEDSEEDRPVLTGKLNLAFNT